MAKEKNPPADAGTNPPPPDAGAPPPPPPPAAVAMVLARVLTPCVLGTNDDLVEIPEAEAVQYLDTGVIDTSPEAVAYAQQVAEARAAAKAEG